MWQCGEEQWRGWVCCRPGALPHGLPFPPAHHPELRLGFPQVRICVELKSKSSELHTCTLTSHWQRRPARWTEHRPVGAWAWPGQSGWFPALFSPISLEHLVRQRLSDLSPSASLSPSPPVCMPRASLPCLSFPTSCGPFLGPPGEHLPDARSLQAHPQQASGKMPPGGPPSPSGLFSSPTDAPPGLGSPPAVQSRAIQHGSHSHLNRN